ncbi:MAG: ABC1 kinase family protein [Acidimicrobiales bacterium]
MRVIAITLGVLAGLILLALLLLFIGGLRRSGWRVLRTRLRRSARIWRLALRRVPRFLRLRRRGDQSELDAFHIETAGQVFELLGGMKGAVMKLGQMVSILGDNLPGPYREVLRGLQASAPPMSYELAAGVVNAELGHEPEVLFRRFSREPIAAASIGQVHRADLDDGTPVAVKVQYPGVDVAISADLDNAFLLTNVAKMMAPGMEPEPLIDELRARIGDELDYRLEASNQEEFRLAYEGHPFVRVPRVFPDYSARRVLTSEWVEGRSFYDLLEAPQDERDLVGEKLFRFWMGSVGTMRFFNADPHPGNYFFRPDGAIWFLDFGMVKRFGPAVIEGMVGQIRALRSGDPARVREAMVAYGWFKPDVELDMDRVYELARFSQEPLVEHQPFTFTTDYSRRVVEATMSIQGPYGDLIRHMTLPAEHMMLNRIQLGVGALLGGLNATNNWAAIFDECLMDGPVATDLGRQVEGWPRPLARLPQE